MQGKSSAEIYKLCSIDFVEFLDTSKFPNTDSSFQVHQIGWESSVDAN